MVLGFAQTTDEASIHELLQSAKLPTSDISTAHLQHFIVMRQAGEVIGVAGVERLGRHSGLVRSIAVKAEARSGGIARKLYHAVEEHACSMGMRELFALTTTIADWLTRLGYERLSRDNAPAELRQTPEFQDLCPDSAIILQKTLRIPSTQLPGVFECAE